MSPAPTAPSSPSPDTDAVPVIEPELEAAASAVDEAEADADADADANADAGAKRETENEPAADARPSLLRRIAASVADPVLRILVIATLISRVGRGIFLTVTVRLAEPNDRTLSIDGNGLTFVPTMFTRRASAPVGDGPPMIMYSARGQGALWEAERVANPAAVAAVLGEARASLLAALGDPASSTELGVRLGVTASAVNQHLRVLRDAGLLVSTRYGRSVLYLRSELGTALLETRAG